MNRKGEAATAIFLVITVFTVFSYFVGNAHGKYACSQTAVSASK